MPKFKANLHKARDVAVACKHICFFLQQKKTFWFYLLFSFIALGFACLVILIHLLPKLARHPFFHQPTSSPSIRKLRVSIRYGNLNSMAMKILTLQTIALILSHLPFISPINFSYPVVFNYGDSNSDTGGLAAGIAFPFGQPYGETYFFNPAGRFCDGRLIIDFLMDSMGLPFLNPYLDSVGAPSFQKGCNFATGGSTILPANAASMSPFSFGIQVSEFIRFKTRVLQLLAKDKRLKKSLPSESDFKQGLYMFDVGQNDVDGAFNSSSEDQVVALIPGIISEFETGLKRLYDEGARNFWIHNTGPLGCLPRIIAKFGKDPSKLNQFGCVISHNNVATALNTQLHDFSVKFRGQFSEANVTLVDIFSIKSNLIANYSQFGFKQPIAACCGYGGLPLNFDNRIACGETKILNGTSVTATACNNTSEYVNWDGNHYTEAANKYVSSQILSGNYTDPPFSMNLQFLLGSDLFYNPNTM